MESPHVDVNRPQCHPHRHRKHPKHSGDNPSNPIGRQSLWGIGTVSAIALAATSLPNSLALAVYQQPLMVLGIGFTFAALTGLFVKEAFCFNRLETKALAPVVPLLLLGHLLGFMPLQGKVVLLAIWASLFLLFAVRKAFQAIPPDIGDKSVFDYLAKVRSGEISPETSQAVG